MASIRRTWLRWVLLAVIVALAATVGVVQAALGAAAEQAAQGVVLDNFPPEVCARVQNPRVCHVPINVPTLAGAIADETCGTIQLRPGTYTGGVVVARSLVITGESADTTVVSGAGLNTPVITVQGPLRGDQRTCVEVRNLTIADGNAADGGGLLNKNGIVVIEYTTVRNNKASGMGGGVYNEGGGAVRLSHSTVRNNVAGARGGGIAGNGIGTNLPGVQEAIDLGNNLFDIASSGAGTLNLTAVPRVLLAVTEAVGGAVIDMIGTIGHVDLDAIQFSMLLLDNTEVVENSINRESGTPFAMGAGLYNQAGIAIIADHSAIDRNVANSGVLSIGGGVTNLIGAMGIVDSSLSGNTMGTSVALGGGVANIGMMVMQRAQVLNNNITGVGFARGGGIQNLAGSIDFSAGRISGNEVHSFAIAGGGGLGNDTLAAALAPESHGANTFIAGSMTLTDSTISDNLAESTLEATGGGIRNEEVLTMVRSTVSGNRVRGGPSPTIPPIQGHRLEGSRGGGLFTRDGAVTIEASTFSGNSVVGRSRFGLFVGMARGGAIFNEATEPDADNGELPSFMDVQPISQVGGISTVDITDSTFAGNSISAEPESAGSGSTIFNRALTLLSNARIRFQGSIVSGGAPGNCTLDLPPFASFVSLGHNLDSGGSCGFTATGDVIHGNPKLGPLQDNGGPTLTHAPDADSPVLNAGFAAGNANCDARRDQRGRLRPYQGACDIGAIEGPPFNLSTFGPASNALGVPSDAAVTVVVDDDLDPASATADNIIVQSRTRGRLDGSVAYSSATRTLTFTPEEAFAPGDSITVSATSRLRSAGGASLANPRAWRFTVATPQYCMVDGFTQVASLPGSHFSSVDWGDYDDDGDLDVLATGVSEVGVINNIYPELTYRSEIYRRNADGTFTAIDAHLKGVAFGNGVWGDYDNDGDLDVLIMGRVSQLYQATSQLSGFAGVYRNDGNSTFTPINAGLPGFESGKASWGDYDADGDLDILLIGQTFLPAAEAWEASGRTTIVVRTNSKIFANTGSGFVDAHAPLPALMEGTGEWGDYDEDGDLDVLLAGRAGVTLTLTPNYVYTPVLMIYRNNGGSLSPVPVIDQHTPLHSGGFFDATASWGDADGDGDLDILYSGRTVVGGFAVSTRLYRNTNGSFTSVPAPFSGMQRGAHAWGDYDGDGDFDILMAGATQPLNGGAAKVFRNDGAAFTDVGGGLTPVSEAGVSWADADGDGRLDIVLSGDPDRADSITRVFAPSHCQAVADSYITPKNEPLTVAAPGLFANDASRRPLVAASIGTPPAHGALSQFAGGGFVYTPQIGFSGPDSFTYTATDGHGASVPGVVSIEVLTRTVSCAATPNNGATVFKAVDASAVRNAIAAAPAGGTVKVAGLCGGVASGGGTAQTAFVDKNLTIEGGYAIGSWAAPTPAVTPTTLDAEGAGRVVRIAAGANVTLRDLVITRGNAGSGNGGGVLLGGGLSQRLERVTLSGNAAHNGGGLSISGNGVAANVEDSTFSSNEAAGSGGAMFASDSGRLHVKTSTISGNTAGQDGGALRNESSAFTSTHLVTVSGNTAGRHGGAVSNASAGVTEFQESTINGNAVSGPFAIGGGLHTIGGQIRLLRSIVSSNAPQNCVGVPFSMQFNLSSDASCNFAAAGDQNSKDPLLGPLAMNGGLTATHAIGYRSPALNAGGAVCTIVDQRGQPRPQSGACDVGAYELAVPAVAAENDTYSATAGTTLTVPVATGVLANDFNQDGPFTALTAVLDAGPPTGTLTLAANGSFTYAAPAGLTGDVTFTYHARDGAVDSNVATVAIKVTTLMTCAATIDGVTIFTSADAKAVQDAVDAASPGDLVRVAGTCAGVQTRNTSYFVTLAQTLLIGKSLTVQGGYAPNVTGDWVARDLLMFPTTLDAQNAGRVVLVDRGLTVELDGLILRRGRTTQDGGGLYNDGSAVTVRNTVIRENVAAGSSGGGGISNGDILHLVPSPMTLVNVTVTNNSALDFLASGGGMRNSGLATTTITNSVFADNTAHSNGAAFYVDGGSVSVLNTTIRNNRITGLGGGGGAFLVDAGQAAAAVTIEKSTMSRNGGSAGGGFFVTRGGVLTVKTSTVSRNYAGQGGDGGGLIIDGGTATFESTTIVNNSTNGRGGGIARFGGAVNVKNTIVGDNIAALNLNCFGGMTSQGNNLDSDDTCTPGASDRTSANIGLAALANNGGPTLTHALLLSSPARENGAGCAATDQRGQTRPNANGLCDIGAFELQGDPAILTIDDAYTGLIGQALVQAAPGVLGNDINASGSPSLTAAVVQGPAHGAVVLAANGGFTYTPAAGFAGEDSFTYRAAGGALQSNVATVRIGVRALLTCRATVVGGATFNSADAKAVQDAVDAAPADGTVKVAGVCAGVHTRNVQQGVNLVAVTQSLYINKNVTVRGGYDGTNWNAASNPVAFPTVVSGVNTGRVVYVDIGRIVTLENLTLTAALSTGDGGAVANQGANLTVRGSRITNSTARQGGAIANSLAFGNPLSINPATLTLQNSTLDGNIATSEGGAIFQIGAASSMTIAGSTISNNRSSFRAGGIFNFSGGLTITNSTLSGNRAIDPVTGVGGAINNRGGLGITSSTIAFNNAGRGGGIAGGGTAADSIIANNIALTNADCDNVLASSGYNIDSSGTCGFGAAGDVSNGNALLMPLADNGGPTLTHAPSAGSYAINAGSCAGNTVVVDQRGVSRPQNFACDIGAYETAEVRTLTQNTGLDGTVSTDVDNDGATAGDPLEVTVTTPGGGSVTIEETAAAGAPSGYRLLGTQAVIAAPRASRQQPLTLVFTVEASLVAAELAPVDVFRNGVIVQPCDGTGEASPDPCLESRAIAADGDVVLTALSSAASTWKFAVRNAAAPTVTAGADAGLIEGATFSRSGSFVDADSASWTATVDYGDGTGAQALALNVKAFTLSHVYPQNGSFTVTVRVTDAEGEVGGDTVLVSVANSTPAVSAGASASLAEGGSLSRNGSFTDPGADTWTAVVDYGDGTLPAPIALAPDRSFAFTHLYRRSGSFLVSVRVVDSDGDIGVATFDALVSNAAPVVAPAANASAVEGQSATFALATFTDVGASDAHAATVNWGDGTSTPGAVFEGDGSGGVSGTHSYADQGVYQVTVDVTDEDGAPSSVSLTIDVTNALPIVSAGGHVSVNSGATVSRFGSFDDSGSADTWTATVDYGDGSGVQPLLLSGKTFLLDHVFHVSGGHAVTVRVADDDGGVGVGAFTVTVAATAPVITAVSANPSPVHAGSPTMITVDFTHPGSQDAHTVEWDFGDGDVVVSPIAAGVLSHSIDHTFGTVGLHPVTVVVRDAGGRVDQDSIVIEVIASDLRFEPALADQLGRERSALTMPVSATDGSDGSGLTLTAAVLPAGAAFDSSPGHMSIKGMLTWTPACDQAGDHVVTLRVADNTGKIVEESLTIHVGEACEALIAVTGMRAGKLSMIGAASNAIASTIDLGPNPVHAAFGDPSLQAGLPPARLFLAGGDADDEGVAANGVLWRLEGPLAPTDATMADVAPIASAGVGNDPVSVVLSPDGRFAWMAHDLGNALSIVETATHTLVATVPLKMPVGVKGTMTFVGDAPAAIAFSPDGQYVYVASRQRKNLVVVDAARAVSDPAHAVAASLKIGSALLALAVAPDGSRVYVATLDDVAVVDTSAPLAPVLIGRVAAGLEPVALALTHDGGKLYVVNFKSDSVSVLTTGGNLPHVVRTIPVGRRPVSIAITWPGSFAGGDRVFVPSRIDHGVTVIDPATDAVVGVLKVPFEPRTASAGIVPSR